MKYLEGAIYVVVICVFGWLMGTLLQNQNQDDVRRGEWAASHHCKRTGFVSSFGSQSEPKPVYTCDDGIAYLWANLPVGDPK
jgi:hypothetical protein